MRTKNTILLGDDGSVGRGGYQEEGAGLRREGADTPLPTMVLWVATAGTKFRIGRQRGKYLISS